MLTFSQQKVNNKHSTSLNYIQFLMTRKTREHDGIQDESCKKRRHNNKCLFSTVKVIF